jgi:hypothetical protein
MKRMLSLLTGCLFLCGFSQLLLAREQNQPAKLASVVITSSMFDIDGDGQKERVELLMTSGKRITEEEMNCSPTYRGFQGRFSIVFQVAGKRVEHPLNRYFADEEMTFRNERWVIRFADYNHDGRPDFNIGQYENCNGYLYKLFSVAPNGEVTPLKIEGHENGIFVSAIDNSTGQIKVTREGFSVQSYNNNPESRCPGNCLTTFAWKSEKQQFAVVRVVPVKE